MDILIWKTSFKLLNLISKSLNMIYYNKWISKRALAFCCRIPMGFPLMYILSNLFDYFFLMSVLGKHLIIFIILKSVGKIHLKH